MPADDGYAERVAALEEALASSERALAEARRKERVLEAILDAIPQGIAITGGPPDYPLLEVSREGWRTAGGRRRGMTGVPSGHGQAAWGLFHLDGTIPSREQMPLYRASHNGEEVHGAEFLLQQPDGSRTPVLVDAVPVRSIDGEVIGALACWRDIADRMRAEEALRESELRTRYLVSSVAQATWETDPAGKVVKDSPSWRAYTGQTLEEWLGDGWVNAVHPGDRDHAERQWCEAVAARANVDAEFRLRHAASGGYRWTNVRAVPLVVHDGAIEKWVVMNIDIHDRKEAEAALRMSEAKASGILAISADGLISIDESQRITMFNDGAEKIFGWSRDEAIGAPLDMLIPERYRAAHRGHVESFRRGGESARRLGTVMALRRHGEEFPVDVAISRLVVDGRVVLTTAMRDITERQRLESDLRRAISSRDEMLGIVAHDLRSPLSTILTQAALLRDPSDKPDRRSNSKRAAELLERSGNRMNRIIDDLLDVTRLEAGQIRLERARVSVADVIAEVVASSGDQVRGRGLELRVRRPEELAALPAVWADKTRVMQVFDNLVGNSLKFTRRGSISIRAKPEGDDIVLSVTDTGPGIHPENIPHVFDRFWQARKARSGAGLGLAIVKGIVEAHGGRVWCRSDVGRGSTFFFTLPAAKSTESADG